MKKTTLSSRAKNNQQTPSDVFHLIGFNIMLFWACDIFVTSEASLEKSGQIFFDYKGPPAIAFGIFCTLFGIYLVYLYLSPLSKKIFELWKSKHWINVTYMSWDLFILMPALDKYFTLSKWQIIFILLSNIILSFLFHIKVNKHT